MYRLIGGLVLIVVSLHPAALRADMVDLTHAVIVVRSGERPAAEKISPTILSEEIARRTGVELPVTDQWPQQASAVVALAVNSAMPAWKSQIPDSAVGKLDKPEAFSIRVVAAQADQPARVFVTGRDARGLMFGVGKLLRVLEMSRGSIRVEAGFSSDLAPDRAIRGHQIGYRPRANSWDAWTIEQFDQYFREMVIFGANAVENIPFEDQDPTSLMKYGRKEFNLKFGELCEKYDLDHWVFVPVQFALPDTVKGEAFLQQQAEFYQACKRLDAVFVPGGDPGDNKAKVLLPYLAEMASVLLKYHPRARIWVSLQGMHEEDFDCVYNLLEEKKPDWLGGVVMGPSSPPMDVTRQRLPAQYKLRWYPDITHIVRCQYPVPWLDPAWGVTLGREGVNPRPVDYAAIYQNDYRWTDGFLSYSDGIHDDFNKQLWSQLGWQPDRPVREIAIEYARFFFRGDLAEAGADAILALENDLRGSIVDNASVDGTLLEWQQLERAAEGSPTNWRFDMHLFRAYYDTYTRHRQIYENELEQIALTRLGEAGDLGVETVLKDAREILNRATTQPQQTEWRGRIEALAEHLFQVIGYQTSVPKYGGTELERGCSLDSLDYPLNNRWWLEDQFDRIEKLTDPAAQRKQLEIVRNWENPGEGGYYDIIGHVGRSPRMVKVFNGGDAMAHVDDLPMPTQRYMGGGRQPLRFAWHNYHDVLPGITYAPLDPQAKYTVRLFAQRSSPLLIDGKPARLTRRGETVDQVTEQLFEVPREAVEDGRIVLTWAKLDEEHLNWRQRHYVTDIWILRQAIDPSQR